MLTSPDFIQAPAHYRFTVGGLRVTALCDGHLALPATLFPAASEADGAALARAAFLPPGPVATAVNAFAIESGGRLYLVDAGVGPSRGPATGRLAAELRMAGFDPASVEAVLLTHMHVDHCGGLLDAAGEKLFRNAELLVAGAEHGFWREPGLAARMPATMGPAIATATAALDAYRGRTTLFTEGEVAPGIAAVPLPGHTPGHSGFLLADGADSVLIWADVVHVAAIQFPHPDWGLVFDIDQAQAAATRVRTFDRVASERLRIAGMHLAFPGLGHVAREGAGWRYLPEPWAPVG
jgi:glyoxylase-like metal-dependent hydrolase (beta-lactamase superfamily II)